MKTGSVSLIVAVLLFAGAAQAQQADAVDIAIDVAAKASFVAATLKQQQAMITKLQQELQQLRQTQDHQAKPPEAPPPPIASPSK